jgi:hypothetical protein
MINLQNAWVSKTLAGSVVVKGTVSYDGTRSLRTVRAEHINGNLITASNGKKYRVVWSDSRVKH